MWSSKGNHGFLKKQKTHFPFSHFLNSPSSTEYLILLSISSIEPYYPLPFLACLRHLSHRYNGQTFREPKAPSKGKKSLRQKRDRRKMTLENKLQEYSDLCGADVCLGIRIRESGQVFIFSADSSGIWSFLRSQLVGIVEYLCTFTIPDFSRPPTIQHQLREARRTSIWRKDRARGTLAFEQAICSMTSHIEDDTG